MDKENTPILISEETIRNQINETSKEKDILIGKIEESAIQDVLNEFNVLYPEGAHNTYKVNRLRAWCGRSVQLLEEKYPELKDNFNRIRNDVWNNVAYNLYKDTFEQVKEEIKKENTKEVKPSYFRKTHPAFLGDVMKNFKNFDGKIDWDFVARKLELTEKQFSYRKKEFLTFDEMAERIAERIKAMQPPLEELSPERICDIDENIYRKLTGVLPRAISKNIPEWSSFVAKLREHGVRQPWSNDKENERSLADCVKEIEELVRTLDPKPDLIDRNFLEFNVNPIYQKLIRILPKRRNASIIWKPFADGLLERGIKFEVTEGQKNEYRNEKELAYALGKDSDLLYLIAYYSHTTTEKEKADAERIVNKLIQLHRKGNMAAREMLERDLEFVSHEWIQKTPELHGWQIASDQLDKIIQSCIYNYKEKGSNFFNYLFFSLKIGVNRLPRKKSDIAKINF